MNLIQVIKEFDTRLFLFLNGKHNAFFDFVMYWASNKFVWIPLYLFFAFLVFKQVGKRIWLVVLAVLMLIVLSDQISNRGFKNNFQRYRPCQNLIIQSQVHVNGGCNGTYGFVSSHAANTFALAMFLGMFFYKKINYFGLFIFSWATFVSYSRIYNGVHYPADVTVGAILGILIGYIIFKWYNKINSAL